MSLHAPREKRVGIAFNAFLGSRAGRFPRRSAKLLKVFDLNATGKPRRVRRKISPSNCIETLAVMTFLRSPHCATCPIPLPRTVCTLSLCRLAVFSPSLSLCFFRGFAKEKFLTTRHFIHNKSGSSCSRSLDGIASLVKVACVAVR